MQGSRVGSCSRWEGARDVLSEISEDGQQKGERRASPTASSDSSEISPTISIFGSETSTDSIPHVRASSIAPVIGGAGLQFLSKAWGSASNADNGMRHGVSNFYVQKDEERPKPRPYGKSNLDSAVTRSFPQYKSTTTAEVLHEQGEDIDVDALLSSLRNCKEDEVIWWSKDHTPLRLPKTAGGDDNKENMYNEPSENWASHGPFSDIDDNKENNDPSKNWANHGPCSESDHSEIVVDTPAGFTCPENVATPEIEECESPPLNPRYLEAMLQTSSELQELEAEIELCTQYDSVPDGEVNVAIVDVTVIFRKVAVVFARSSLSSGLGVVAT
ncbi:hypothetical protein R1sor_023705 [Riccia sorocarpa]|uniref:Uncharacterized protein n=1 Tax=Riccia sorocarpa TaxID=122646 RepID=A0ABD3GUB9_9MARC